MSKRTEEAARVAALPSEKRNLLPAECLELQEMQRMVNARKFEAAQVKGNTALIPRGQEVAAELDAIARLLDNCTKQWVATKLKECGYQEGERCNINLSNGEIILTPNEPTISPEAA